MSYQSEGSERWQQKHCLNYSLWVINIGLCYIGVLLYWSCFWERGVKEDIGVKASDNNRKLEKTVQEGASWFVIFTRYYSGGQTKHDEMEDARFTYGGGGGEKYAQRFCGGKSWRDLSQNIMGVIKSIKISWVGHVACMGDSRGAYRVLAGRPKGKRTL